MSRRNPGEGSVYQRTDGRWTGSVQVNGKRSYAYGKSERDVKRKLLAIQKQLNVSGVLPTPGNKSLNDLLDTWLENVRHTLKPRTVADYESHCDRYIKPVIGNIKLAQLTPMHLQGLYAGMQTRGIGRTTLYVHAILHRALNLAVLWNWLPQNPADRIIKPRHHAERKELWTPDELGRFLEATTDDWLAPLWTVAIATGCRLGELVGLKWEDVTLATGCVTVRRNLQPIKGQWVEGTPKTKAGERSISLPHEAVVALRRQKAQQAEWRLQAGERWNDRGLLFTSLNGEPLSRSTIEHNLTRQCRRLGIREVTPHGLRHLHASLLLSEGTPITAVSSRLGHANPSITMSVYAHAMRRQDEEAARVMHNVLSGVV